MEQQIPSAAPFSSDHSLPLVLSSANHMLTASHTSSRHLSDAARRSPPHPVVTNPHGNHLVARAAPAKTSAPIKLDLLSHFCHSLYSVSLRWSNSGLAGRRREISDQQQGSTAESENTGRDVKRSFVPVGVMRVRFALMLRVVCGCMSGEIRSDVILGHTIRSEGVAAFNTIHPPQRGPARGGLCLICLDVTSG